MDRKLPHARCYRPADIPAEWRELLLLIPGYDSIATAGDCWFDADAAQLANDFFPECLHYIEGDVAGKPFVLSRWQKAIVACLFGWKRWHASGKAVRRYIEVFLFVARKNGKTPFVAGLALLVFFTDPELGQQDSIAAADKKQASKLFRHCRGMIERMPALAARCKIYGGTQEAGQNKSIVREEDDSYLEIISADATGKHGSLPHLVLIDELHEQPNSELVDTLESGFVSANRAEPLFICLTTADYDRPSVCNRKYDYASKVAEGSRAIARGASPESVVHDPQFLPVLYEVPRDVDWRDESQWHKANPNLGVSVDLDKLRRMCKKAQEQPEEEHRFRRLHLNQKTSTDSRLLSLELWDAGATTIDEAKLEGRECFAALDIGAISDLCALARLFPHDDAEEVEVAGEIDAANPEAKPGVRVFVRRSYTLLMTFWQPERPQAKRDPRMAAQLETWKRQGLIRTTPGSVVDYDMVLDDVVKLLDPYQFVDLAFDRGFQGAQMGTNLMRIYGDKVIAFSQGILSMAAPCREFMELMIVKRIHHEGHPVMRWNVGNVVGETRGGLLKFSKGKSPEKIDGVTAAVMALGRSMFAVANAPRSVYDGRGVTVL